MWYKGAHQGQEIYKNVVRIAKNRIRRLNNLKYQPIQRCKTTDKKRTK